MIKEAAIEFAEPLLEENQVWSLLKKVIHYDPLRDVRVDASMVEILEDFLRLIHKEQELEQMRERGTLQKTADWLETQVGTFNSLISELRGLINEAWEAIRPENLANLNNNLQNLATRAGNFLERVWNFASTVALEVLALIKEALLNWLSTFANDIQGYHLLTVLLEKDPFTQERVPRNATNLIRGFISLLPSGEEQFQQMQESGVIPEAAQRIEGLMTELGITWPFVQQLFLDIWNSLTIDDLLNPPDAFIRVLNRFEEPLTRLFTFVIEVIKVVLELILVLMNFPSDLIGSIITNSLQALDDIQQDPVGFLINLLETAKRGFERFFDNIVEHLLGGLTDWLFSAVREAGVEPPADFSFESILGFVLDVLGLSMDHMWELLGEHIGRERADQMRGAIDRVMEIAGEAWGFIQDVQERGMVAVWEYIESQLTNLWDMVLQQVQDFVTERVINVGMRWLMSLLDATGITPVINSFVAFFNAVQSAIQYLREMLEVVNDFVTTVASIARGDIEPGAERMEQGLGNSIPIVIGFIANQLGLGDVGQRLGEVIESVRGLVDRALNWLIEQALRLGRAVLTGLGLGTGTTTNSTEGSQPEDQTVQVQKGFSIAGESHTLTVSTENGHLVIAMSSARRLVLSTYLPTIRDELSAYQVSEAAAAEKAFLLNFINRAIPLVNEDPMPEWNQQQTTEARNARSLNAFIDAKLNPIVEVLSRLANLNPPLRNLDKMLERLLIGDGPYSNLIQFDPHPLRPKAPFSTTQRNRILAENWARNERRTLPTGRPEYKSDYSADYFLILDDSLPAGEDRKPEIDHIHHKSRGGSNSYSNARVVSGKYNGERGNKD